MKNAYLQTPVLRPSDVSSHRFPGGARSEPRFLTEPVGSRVRTELDTLGREAAHVIPGECLVLRRGNYRYLYPKLPLENLHLRHSLNVRQPCQHFRHPNGKPQAVVVDDEFAAEKLNRAGASLSDHVLNLAEPRPVLPVHKIRH